MGGTDTTNDAWARLGELTPGALADALLELHWAVQLVAAAGQTFAEPADDDSHRAMTWHPGLRAFVGAPFAGAYPLRVAVRPDDLTLLILDRTDAAIAVLRLPGQSLDEAHEWIGLAVATYFGGAPPTLERPEYDLPEHPVRHGARFSTASGIEREVAASLYDAAATTLAEVVAVEDTASEVRCWPHHFDIATLVRVGESGDGEAARTIGVGLAPSGGGCALWYWYVSPWPYPEPAELPDLDVGHWHTEGWTGAVLPGEDLVAVPSDERAALARAFVRGAMDAAREVLG